MKFRFKIKADRFETWVNSDELLPHMRVEAYIKDMLNCGIKLEMILITLEQV